MPVMRELTLEIQAKLGQEGQPLRPPVPHGFGADLEAWLSYLAGDQPWLTKAENLRNQALFLDASRLLADTLIERQNITLAEAMPDWLHRLIDWWHDRRVTIATFNYDTLVEKAATQVLRDRPGGTAYFAHFRPLPIPSTGVRTASVYGAGEFETFSVLKLHGSIDWVYSGSPEFYGEQIYSIPMAQRWEPDDPARLGRDAMDKVPLVVPPTAGKSAFFNNETIRGQWQLCQQQVAEAKELYIVGYSLPTTDAMVRWMLQTAKPEISNRPRLTIVNPDPGVINRAEGISYEVTHHITSVEEMVSILEQEQQS